MPLKKAGIAILMYTHDSTGIVGLTIPSAGEILEDVSGSGKARPWKSKKSRSLLTADIYKAAGIKGRAKRMKACAETLVFTGDPSGKLNLYQAYFCHVRLCPMCNWRRSLKIAFQNAQIVEAANKAEPLKWLFLTLTVKNVTGSELPDTLRAMTAGFDRMFRRKAVKTAVRGYFRALEITHKRHDDYHPHFHVLICVKPSYFSKGYISQAKWTSMWQQSMKMNYTPIVHVERVKPKKDLKKLQQYSTAVQKAISENAALAEISKYPVKDADVIKGDKVTAENVETVQTLDKALTRKRLIGYGGLLKEIRADLQLEDAEDGNLVDVDSTDDETLGVVDVIARWHIGIKDYVIVSVMEKQNDAEN